MFGKSIKKYLITLKHLKRNAKYYYGSGAIGIFKFLYYSTIRINKFIVYENDLNKKLSPMELENDIRILKPTLYELEKLRSGSELPREFYCDQIHKVKNCYIALVKDEVAYIHWVYSKEDCSRFFILGEHTAELNYNTTLPKFRGRRLSVKMMVYISFDLQRSGIKKLVSCIHEENIAAIKCIKAAGFKEVFNIKTVGHINRKYAIN